MSTPPSLKAGAEQGSPPLVLILGGGRWARVIAGVVLDLVDGRTGVAVASPAGGDDLAAWIEKSGHAGRIALVDRDSIELPAGTLVIVANAARDHASTTLWALARGAAVLVEKPFALDSTGAAQMIAAASRNQTLLASALVFRFASYLPKLAALLAKIGPIGSVELFWSDPRAEQRYGETKRFDAGVSVLQDCLPHVASILATLFGPLPEFDELSVDRGGARVRLALSAGDQTFNVLLERNGMARQRLLRVLGSSGTIEFDFTVEPGAIRINGEPYPFEDAEWSAGRRPLASMIAAFIDAGTGAPLDPRLAPDLAVQACSLVEDAMAIYRRELATQMSGGLLAEDETYALTELLQLSGRLGDPQLRLALEDLRSGKARRAALAGWASLEVEAASARRRAI